MLGGKSGEKNNSWSCTNYRCIVYVYNMYVFSGLQMSISDGLGSRKLEVLADTAVTLEQSTEGAVVTEVIKKMLKVCSSGIYKCVHIRV